MIGSITETLTPAANAILKRLAYDRDELMNLCDKKGSVRTTEMYCGNELSDDGNFFSVDFFDTVAHRYDVEATLSYDEWLDNTPTWDREKTFSIFLKEMPTLRDRMVLKEAIESACTDVLDRFSEE